MAFLSDVVPAAFERTLTATAHGFERDLRQAWPGATGSAAERSFAVEAGGCVLQIDIEPAGVRRLGLFELPQLIARYRFLRGDEAERRDLLRRLDRAMQKGGG
ncbi:hypothetical protein [Thauera sp. 2A1]|uniref:hypothetical protein n=1 Tax=Thauera sp. 2A1 TaxID=2570191 RepID=UPI0012917398|nr:hypothetical protein [Thauera sp. 2A1]KAI5912796.1 hypothetical protein GH664_20470 [Thauera sp. 2A1]